MRTIIIATLFLLNMTTFANENIEPFSEEVLKAIDVLKQAIEVSYHNDKKDDYPKLEVQYNDYSKAVKKLGTLITDNQAKKLSLLTEPNLNQALSIMSYNINRFPDQLEELLKYYKRIGGPRPTTSYLRIMHVTETFRHAWEYFFLAPPTVIVEGMRRGNSYKYPFLALYGINCSETLVIYLYLYSIKIQSNYYNASTDLTILSQVSHFPSGITPVLWTEC